MHGQHEDVAKELLGARQVCVAQSEPTKLVDGLAAPGNENLHTVLAKVGDESISVAGVQFVILVHVEELPVQAGTRRASQLGDLCQLALVHGRDLSTPRDILRKMSKAQVEDGSLYVVHPTVERPTGQVSIWGPAVVP